jgi:hemolysin D
MTTLKLRVDAIGDLVGRYVRVLHTSWRVRKTMDCPGRLPLERQFLPAALELLETPPSPLPRALLWTIIAIFAASLAWSVVGRLDTVAVAQGKVIASTGAQVVQSFDTAVVKRILVRDGQAVKKGDVLVELDGTLPQADSVQARDAWVAVRIESARARALLASMNHGQPPTLGGVQGIEPARLAVEGAVLASQFVEYRSKLAALDAEAAKRQAELDSTRQLVIKLRETAAIAKQRADDYKSLMERGYVSRHGYLDRERERIEEERTLAYQGARLVELENAIRETRERRGAYVAEIRRQVTGALNEAERRETNLAQELVKTDQRQRLMQLTAPVDGIVQQLAVHTEGGVVTEAQPLLVVTPRDYQVEVEVALENKDVGFVRQGQPGAVKVQTFPFTRYGTIPASVTFVSNDAASDEKRGLIFQAKLVLERSTIRVDEREVNLVPGMAVTAEIKTGSRRVIEYFLSPILQTAQESLRER